jgi:histidinol-phosphate aminotransferase
VTISIEEKVRHLIRPEILTAGAYSVADASGLIKLDAMENPFPWPPEIKAEWLRTLAEVEVNRYPDPNPRQLKQQLREALGVPAGVEVLLGNGSDELIQLVQLAVARAGAHVLAPTPTFVMYEVIARAIGIDFVGVPLTDTFELDLPAMRAALGRCRPAITFLAYPNNPTGNLFDSEAVEALIDQATGLVVVDEAYFAFADATFMDRLQSHDNLLVLRTLSKVGLAGLRFGMLAGAPEWLVQLDKVRLPYNVNSLTQVSVAFALAHREFLDAQVACVRRERQRLYAALARMPGLRAWLSEANFILFRVPAGRAAEIHQALYAAGVLLKNLDSAGGALRDCLRVTVGTPEENRFFLEALKSAVDG